MKDFLTMCLQNRKNGEDYMSVTYKENLSSCASS